MKFKGHLITSLLRVLTPEEISELTTSFSGQKKVSLSLLLATDVDGGSYKQVIAEKTKEKDGVVEFEGAKILEFEEHIAKGSNSEVVQIDKEVSFHFQSGQRVHKLLEAYTHTFKKMDKNVFGQQRFPKKVGSVNTKQTSTMIMEEKKKLYNSYSKIKRMEVLSLYKDTSGVDIQSQKRNKEDLGHSSSLGVLVNKKQA